MRLTSTDLSSLTAIAVGAAIGIGLTGLWWSEGANAGDADVEVTHEQIERVRADGSDERVHHDHEREVERHVVRHETERGERPVPADRGDAERSTAGVIVAVPGSGQPVTDPLIYVDNIRVTEMPELAPGRIDRVEIVKGDAALELYGPEAADGVIQIFTKAAATENPGP